MPGEGDRRNSHVAEVVNRFYPARYKALQIDSQTLINRFGVDTIFEENSFSSLNYWLCMRWQKQHGYCFLKQLYFFKYILTPFNGGMKKLNNFFPRWIELSGKSSSECVRILLTCTRKWQFYGSSLFKVKVKYSLNNRRNIYIEVSINYIKCVCWKNELKCFSEINNCKSY